MKSSTTDSVSGSTIALHQWAVEVSYLLTIAKPEGWQDALDRLVSIEHDHSLIDADGEVTY